MPVHAGLRKAALLALFLSVFLVFTVSAACPETNLVVRQSNVTIANPGALTPGMGVAVSVRIDFPDKENSTYPETNQLELTTDLDKPVWSWRIERNGMELPLTEDTRPRIVIGGGDLSWPANTSEFLKVGVEGIAPPVVENRNLTVIRIRDIAGTACAGDTVYHYQAWVLNTTITRERIQHLDAGIEQLRTDAAAKGRTGADISGVMEKAGEARRSLDTANSTPVFEFASVAVALDRTESSLAEGRHLLEDVPVSGTTPSQQGGEGMPEELPGTPRQTLASPVSIAVPALAVLAAGGIVAGGRKKRINNDNFPNTW